MIRAKRVKLTRGLDTKAANIAGVAAALGAIRGLERWVNDSHVRAAFTGFAALPETVEEDWRQVLGLQEVDEPTAELVESAYRKLAARNHPDRGGSDKAMARINDEVRDQRRDVQHVPYPLTQQGGVRAVDGKTPANRAQITVCPASEGGIQVEMAATKRITGWLTS